VDVLNIFKIQVNQVKPVRKQITRMKKIVIDMFGPIENQSLPVLCIAFCALVLSIHCCKWWRYKCQIWSIWPSLLMHCFTLDNTYIHNNLHVTCLMQSTFDGANVRIFIVSSNSFFNNHVVSEKNTFYVKVSFWAKLMKS